MADSGYSILDGCDGSLVNIVNMDNLDKWLLVKSDFCFLMSEVCSLLSVLRCLLSVV